MYRVFRFIAVFLLFIFSVCLASARTINKGVEEIHEGGLVSYVDLTVKGILVVYGDLEMWDKKDLKIEEGGIVIVTGDLSIGKNVDVAASGYLIAESFSATGKWGGKFQVGDESKVYINEVYVAGDFKHLPVLRDGKHSEIPDLETNNPEVWEYYQKVVRGATGGVVSLVGSAFVCEGKPLPYIESTSSAWPRAYNSYSWEYSLDNSIWYSFGGSSIECDLDLVAPSSLRKAGKYFYRRVVTKTNGFGETMYSNVVELEIVPLPHPLGIFHN